MAKQSHHTGLTINETVAGWKDIAFPDSTHLDGQIVDELKSKLPGPATHSYHGDPKVNYSVDLTNVIEVSSLAIAAIITGHYATSEEGYRFCIISGKGHWVDIIVPLKLHKLIETYEDRSSFEEERDN